MDSVKAYIIIDESEYVASRLCYFNEVQLLRENCDKRLSTISERAVAG